MVTCGIAKNGLSKSKVDSCGVCCLIVMVNSVLCLQCDRWIHGRCAGVKWVTAKFLQILHTENVKGIFERQCNKENLCDEWNPREFTYLSNRVSAGGGCEAAVTGRIR